MSNTINTKTSSGQFFKMARGNKVRRFWLYPDGSAGEVGLSGRIPDFADEFIRLAETGWKKVE